MKVENVNVRVSVEGSEVFVTCDEPYMNFVINLGKDSSGLKDGIHSLEIVPAKPTEAKIEAKSDKK